ncbi:MAG TPA: PhzF family phenazine biosynthesis protein, partial [Gemmatimonadales bacterium]|nr:PhzF family phenazine biosynthesis protein [Gemmatimonadales bacterium]
MTLRYRQVDVFTAVPYRGNGLAVFPERGSLTARQMLAIAGELRQFESIFLASGATPEEVSARIFTVEEELPFAGHPVLGAAAVLHADRAADRERAIWRFVLQEKTVPVESRKTGMGWAAIMDQGLAVFGPPLARAQEGPFLAALSLTPADRPGDLPLQMVSTGLPYLIVPLRTDIGRARIAGPGFEALLGSVGAKFVYVLDPARPEGRTWDNQGAVEDVATGSAAGPTGAYLVRHGIAR